jgi:hypothetical protein
MPSYALTTKERIKDRLGITVTDFDTVIDRLIVSVSERVERMCGRHFIQATYSNELYDGSDPVYGSCRELLIIKNAPLLSISSVEYKTGLNSSPTWVAFTEDQYDVDMDLGVLYFFAPLPAGRRNIRISYTGGYSAASININNYWVFNATPTGAVDGSNRVFTLPVNASQVVVYADGVRISSANYAFTADTDEITFNAGQQPTSTISVDYLPSTGTSSESDPTLPADIMEVCDEAVVRIYKRRDSEGRSSEQFQESSITWNKTIFTDEDLATIRNYRRGTNV